MYNELRMYCKSEGISEYVLRSEVKLGSIKRDTGKNEKELRTGKKDAGSMKKAG